MKARVKPATLTLLLTLTITLACAMAYVTAQPFQANVVVANVFWGYPNLSSPSGVPANTIQANPGNVNLPLTIILQNVGDDTARNVNATLLLQPPLIQSYYAAGRLQYANYLSKFPGDINQGTIFPVTFVLSIAANATAGIYRYRLHLTYVSANSLQRIDKTENLDVPVWNGSIHVERITTVPTKIFPTDRQVQVSVWMVNSGQAEAKNIQLRLMLRPPFKESSSGSSQFLLGSIQPRQLMPINFTIDVADNATAGVHPTPLVQVFPVEKTTRIAEIPLYVEKRDIFKIDRVNPPVFNPGQSDVLMQVELSNLGPVDAYDVTVTLRPSNFFSGKLIDYLGDLAAGTVGKAYLTLTVSQQTPPGDYPLEFDVSWSEYHPGSPNSNLSHTQHEPYTLTIKVTPLNPLVPISIGGVIAIAAGMSYFFFKRHRRETSAHKS